MTPKEVLALCREREIRAVDLRFLDFAGGHRHFTVPAGQLTEERFEDGFLFDASSVRGWQAINESDMLVVPDAATAVVDPFEDHTLTLTGNIQDPVTREDYAKDPRFVARKAADFIQTLGLADECRVQSEAEFFVFDSAHFRVDRHEAFHRLESSEGDWGTSGGGRAISAGDGYFPVPPADTLQSLRTEVMLALEDAGVPVVQQHHEVASGGQCAVTLAPLPMLEACDALVRLKSIVKNVAARRGQTATFMPKPLFDDAGSGLHLSLQLFRDGESLLAGSGYGGLSDDAMSVVGGLLQHTPALMAFCCPTTNSYKRLVPGFEAPVNLSYSYRNRSAAVRIPAPATAEDPRSVEYRVPDASANPYLAIAAVMMAAADGLRSRKKAGPPLDKDIYDLPPETLTDFDRTPPTLSDTLEALESDQQFLLDGDVFTDDVIATWVATKRESEVRELRGRPHPWEFVRYFDA